MSKKNSFIIDCIKVLASQAVLWGHCFGFFGISVFKDERYFPCIQNIGVILLFAVSGFLFQHSLNTGGYSFRKYFASRFIRIKLPYMGAMMLICILDSISLMINKSAFIYDDAFNLKTFAGNLLMLQNYPVTLLLDKAMGTDFTVKVFSSARPFWTLSIQWWIYMFFGYFYLKLKWEKKLTARMLLLGMFFMIVPICHILLEPHLTLVWFGGILVGKLYKNIDIKSVWLKRWMLLLSAIALLVASVYTRDAYNIGFWALVLLLMVLLFNYYNDDENSMSDKWFYCLIRRLSGYHYSLYLLHYSVIVLLIGIPDWNIPNKVKMGFALIISNMLAYAFSRTFENKESMIIRNFSKKIHRLLKV